jgi:hypothetical protein
MRSAFKKVYRTLFATSFALFALAFASAVFLANLGLYLALGFVFAGSLLMLLASLVRERAKQVSTKRKSVHLLAEPEKASA